MNELYRTPKSSFSPTRDGATLLDFGLMVICAVFAIGSFVFIAIQLYGGSLQLAQPTLSHPNDNLSSSQQRLVDVLTKIHEFRRRYGTLTQPRPIIKNPTMAESLLLQPVSLQLRQWEQYEALLEAVPSWLELGLDNLVGMSKYPNDTLNITHLYRRFETVANGCESAMDSLQRHVLNLNDISLTCKKFLEKSFRKDTKGSLQLVSNDTKTAYDNSSWIDIVKHDFGDLVADIESNEAKVNINVFPPSAKLETVSIVGNPQKSEKLALSLLDLSSNRYILAKPAMSYETVDDAQFIREFLELFLVSLSFGLLAEFLGLPALFGNLVAGIILGPSGLDRVQYLVQVTTAGSLALLLVVYHLGIDFNLREVRPVAAQVLFVSLGSSIAGIMISLLVGRLILDISVNQAAFCGLTFSFSSTVLALSLLHDGEAPITWIGRRICMGVLVLQDLLFCGTLALLHSLPKSSGSNMFTMAILMFVFKVFLFSGVVFLVSIIGLDKARLSLSPTGTLVLCGVYAYLGHRVLELNLEIGVFIGAAAIKFSHYREGTAAGIEQKRLFKCSLANLFPLEATHEGQKLVSINELATAIFFASVGLLIDVRFLYGELSVLLLATIIVILVKLGIMAILFLILRMKIRRAIKCAVAFAPISEVALVLGSQARNVGVISAECSYTIAAIMVLSYLAGSVARSLNRNYQWLQ